MMLFWKREEEKIQSFESQALSQTNGKLIICFYSIKIEFYMKEILTQAHSKIVQIGLAISVGYAMKMNIYTNIKDGKIILSNSWVYIFLSMVQNCVCHTHTV